MVVTERKTKDVRREEILDAALEEFAERGLHGASTEDDRAARGHLAALRLPALRHEEGALHRRRQPLLPARRSRCSSGRPRGCGARRRSRRWGRPTSSGCTTDPDQPARPDAGLRRLRRPEIREVVRQGYGDLVAYVERVSGLPAEAVVALLRDRDAAERVRVDGERRRGRRAVGAAAARRLQGTGIESIVLFFSIGGK